MLARCVPIASGANQGACRHIKTLFIAGDVNNLGLPNKKTDWS